MPIYNRLTAWLPVNPTDFVTSDEEYDDTYDFDYPSSDSDTDLEEEEYECLYSRENRKFKQFGTTFQKRSSIFSNSEMVEKYSLDSMYIMYIIYYVFFLLNDNSI